VTSFARGEGKTKQLSDLADDQSFREAIDGALRRANQRLSPIERIRRFKILPEPFTIENGTMTPTLKLKRQIIYKNHETTIAELYGNKRT